MYSAMTFCRSSAARNRVSAIMTTGNLLPTACFDLYIIARGQRRLLQRQIGAFAPRCDRRRSKICFFSFFFFFGAPGIWDWQGTRTGNLYRRRFASSTTQSRSSKQTSNSSSIMLPGRRRSCGCITYHCTRTVPYYANPTRGQCWSFTKPSNGMQPNMNAFPALTKKGLPYPSGRQPPRVMREGPRSISRSKTFRECDTRTTKKAI
jgi:hypothetical protein